MTDNFEKFSWNYIFFNQTSKCTRFSITTLNTFYHNWFEIHHKSSWNKSLKEPLFDLLSKKWSRCWIITLSFVSEKKVRYDSSMLCCGPLSEFVSIFPSGCIPCSMKIKKMFVSFKKRMFKLNMNTYTKKLPARIPNLNTSLTDVDGNNFSHFT